MNKIDIINTFSNIRSSSTFMQLHHYKNDAGEIADYNLVFNISYKSALQRSINRLKSYTPENSLEETAKNQLIDGYQKSLNSFHSHTNEKNYSYYHRNDGSLIKGIKLHIPTNTLHLYGAVLNKKVITPVHYKKVNKSDLTLAKDKLKKLTPLNAFRQFKISSENLHKISVEKLKINP